jgi:hypothetical protein
MNLSISRTLVRVLIVVGIILSLMLAAGAPSDFPNGLIVLSSWVM